MVSNSSFEIEKQIEDKDKEVSIFIESLNLHKFSEESVYSYIDYIHTKCFGKSTKEHMSQNSNNFKDMNATRIRSAIRYKDNRILDFENKDIKSQDDFKKQVILYYPKRYPKDIDATKEILSAAVEDYFSQRDKASLPNPPVHP